MSVKPNLLLDLDQTIISGEPTEEYDFDKNKEKQKLFRHDNMDDYYLIFSRPGLQDFLDYVFKHYNVSVWTAASKDYALFIIKNIILNNNPSRKLDFIFFSYHCSWSKSCKKGSKNLSMLWDIYNLPGYNEKNTIILDDYIEDVHKTQPDNCIIAVPFEFVKEGSEKDTFLKDVIPHMEDMRQRIDSGEHAKTSIVNIKIKEEQK